MKRLQSVCKRTRSRSKQTSLLDFDVPKTRRPTSSPSSLSKRPAEPASATAAAAAASSSDEEGGGTRGKARATSSGRGKSAEGGKPAGEKRRSSSRERSSSRGRSKKRASAAGIEIVAAAKAKTSEAKPPADGDIEPDVRPKASNKRRRVSKAGAVATSSTRQQERDEGKAPSSSSAAAVAASRARPTAKRGRRLSTVCLDVTIADADPPTAVVAKPAAKKPAEKRSRRVKHPLPRQSRERDASATAAAPLPPPPQQPAITPSPHPLARKKARKKKAEALGSSSGIGGGSPDGPSPDGPSRRSENMEATPLNGTGELKAEGDDDGDDPEKDAAEGTTEVCPAQSSGVLSVNRSVTIDPHDSSSPLPTHQEAKEDTHPPPSRPAAPAFRQPWMRPYAPCLPRTPSSGNGRAFLPEGVVDIDLFPHSCCGRSLQSHRGCSWITSERRCGCARDSDHCGGEAVTEAYLGTYGVDRYSPCVGTAGNAERNDDDWEAERWWLSQTRKERARIDLLDSWRTPSPTCALSDAGSISESGSSSSGESGRSLPPVPHCVPEHLDYMERQPHVTVEMRKILVDWLLEVTEEYKLGTETFWLAVALVDRSLACSYSADDAADGGGRRRGERSNDGRRKGEGGGIVVGGEMVVQKDKLQLLGCACTLIAAKLVEITPPTAEDFVFISDKTYTRKEILDTEASVCDALRFHLNFRTPFHYVDRFLRASYASSESSTSPSSAATSSPLSPHGAAAGGHLAISSSGRNNANNVLVRKMVFYLLDLAALEYKLVSKKPGLVAAAAVYLARATLGVREPPPPPTSSSPPSPVFDLSLQRASGGHWSKTLEYYTGYDSWDLEGPVKLLRRLQESAEDDSSSNGVFGKHKGERCRRVALRTAVNESDLGFP